MVPLTSLWLPILVSAVIVFLASWILHMLLPLHRSDYKKLPNEEAVLEAMRKAGVVPGNYAFPHCAGPKEMNSPETVEKFKKGPCGMLNVIPSGPPAMGKYLALWFLFCVVISVFAAYLAGRTLTDGAEYLAVFRVVGTVAFIGYGASQLSDSIWKGQAWGTTFKHIFDGLIYALLTAGVFGWLWPRG